LAKEMCHELLTGITVRHLFLYNDTICLTQPADAEEMINSIIKRFASN